MYKDKKEKGELPDPSVFKDIEAGEEGLFVGYDKMGLSRDNLPIAKSKREILYTVEKYSTTVIVAETGSGKTTQIPQYLVEAGYAIGGKCIAVTVPRRMAAVSVSKRVAEEMHLTLGNEVGYHIRFDDKSSPNTLIKFLTDGMLIREMMQDPLLSRYSVIMVDDIHERTVFSDIIMGLLKKIRRKRPELKIIVSSATLNAEMFATYFEDEKHNFHSKILTIEGRMYPVDIYYLKQPCKNYVTKAAELALAIHDNKPDGDILVFLTGQEEIDTFIEMINNLSHTIKSKKKLFCVPLFGNMPMQAQMDVFNKAPYNTRKLIVATNIAESSVTIDGIVYVIDSCYVKIKYYDYIKGYESLVVVPISQSSGNQRAGRAGRVRSGECYRLCTKEDFENLYPNSAPEIIRSNLANVILQMKALGIGNIMKFEYVTMPTEESFVRALELLYSLGAIDKNGNLTDDIGWKLAEMPIEPRLGVLLINSGKPQFNCSEEILKLVAMLSVQNIFFATAPSGSVIKAKKKLGAKEGDHITLINIFIRYEHLKNENNRKGMCKENGINEKSMQAALQIHKQLVKYMKKYKIPIVASDDDPEAIMKCVVTGFFDKVAQRQPDGSYRSIRGKEKLYLHPHSVMNAIFPDWVIFNEVVRTGKTYMREVSSIDPKWLTELAPHFYEDNKVKLIEEKRKKEMDELAKFEAQEKKKIKTNDAKNKKKTLAFAISDMDFGD